MRLAAVASLSVLLAVGCGGKQSVASKSAAAYQEALEKGMPIGEGGHGGHAVPAKGGMAGMGHSKMKQGGMAGMDHSKMKQGGMAGMDHSKTGESMAMGDPATAAIVADKSAAPTAGKPAAILSPDPLDAPATTAVEDAQRSKQMNETTASGDGMTMSHGNYVQRDAGRLQTPPDSSTPETRQTEAYVCPMHAEVKSTVPGKCPKCGMTLMKKGKTGK